MKKYEEYMAPEFDLPSDPDQLHQVLKTLAGTANKRLERLEKQVAAGKVSEDVYRYAYGRAMRDISEWTGDDERKRFPTAGKSVAAMKAEIQDIKTFLKAPTSTKSSLVGSYEKRTAAFNKEYKTNFKWNELKDVMDSDLADKIDRKLGYRTRNKILARMYKRKDQILKAFANNKEKKLRFAPDQVGREMKKIIEEYGEDVVKALSK